MGKIIVITFAFMAFAFYELSEGSEFVSIADEKRAELAVVQAEETRVLAEAKSEQLKLAGRSEEPEAQIVLASAVVSTTQSAPQTQTATLVVEEEKVEDVAAVEPVEAAPVLDIREVTAARVNMRQGPGRNFSVVAKLSNGDQVEILQDPGDGWVKLRVTESGRIGWTADFLLTASNN